MRIFLAIIAVITLTASAIAQEGKYPPGELAWAEAVHNCFQRIAPVCGIREDNPNRPGRLSIWCPTQTPEHIQAQKTCDAEGKDQTKPKMWKPR